MPSASVKRVRRRRFVSLRSLNDRGVLRSLNDRGVLRSLHDRGSLDDRGRFVSLRSLNDRCSLDDRGRFVSLRSLNARGVGAGIRGAVLGAGDERGGRLEAVAAGGGELAGTRHETGQAALVLVRVLQRTAGPRRESAAEDRPDVRGGDRGDRALVEAGDRLQRPGEQHPLLQVLQRQHRAAGAVPCPQARPEAEAAAVLVVVGEAAPGRPALAASLLHPPVQARHRRRPAAERRRQERLPCLREAALVEHAQRTGWVPGLERRLFDGCRFHALADGGDRLGQEPSDDARGEESARRVDDDRGPAQLPHEVERLRELLVARVRIAHDLDERPGVRRREVDTNAPGATHRLRQGLDHDVRIRHLGRAIGPQHHVDPGVRGEPGERGGRRVVPDHADLPDRGPGDAAGPAPAGLDLLPVEEGHRDQILRDLSVGEGDEVARLDLRGGLDVDRGALDRRGERGTRGGERCALQLRAQQGGHGRQHRRDGRGCGGAARDAEPLLVPRLQRRRMRGDPGAGAVLEVGERGELVDDADGQCVLGAEPGGRQDHLLQRPLQSQHPDRACDAPAAGEEAERHLGQAEPCTRDVGCGDAVVAGERHLQPPAEGGAVHRRDDRPAERLQATQQPLHVLDVRGLLRGLGGVGGAEQVQVAAGEPAVGRRGEDDPGDGVALGLEPVDGRPQCADEVRVHGVHGAVRIGHRDRDDPVGILRPGVAGGHGGVLGGSHAGSFRRAR